MNGAILRPKRNIISGVSDTEFSFIEVTGNKPWWPFPLQQSFPQIFFSLSLLLSYPVWAVFLSFSWLPPNKNASQFSSALSREIFNTQEFWCKGDCKTSWKDGWAYRLRVGSFPTALVSARDKSLIECDTRHQHHKLVNATKTLTL